MTAPALASVLAAFGVTRIKTLGALQLGQAKELAGQARVGPPNFARLVVPPREGSSPTSSGAGSQVAARSRLCSAPGMLPSGGSTPRSGSSPVVRASAPRQLANLSALLQGAQRLAAGCKRETITAVGDDEIKCEATGLMSSPERGASPGGGSGGAGHLE